MIFIITECTECQNIESLISVAAFGSDNCLNSICDEMEQDPDLFNWKYIPIFLGINSKVLRDCVVFVEELVSLVHTTIVPLY